MKLRNWIFIGTAALFAAAGNPTQLFAQEDQLKDSKHHHYKLIDLGTLGGTSSFGNGVNNKSWVSGSSFLQHDQVQHAFLWKNGRMMNLGTLGGPNSTVSGEGLNESGQVVGAAETSVLDPNGEDFCAFGTHLVCLPFLWQAGIMTALPTLGGNNGVASDINNRGEVGGTAENATRNTACSLGGLETKPVIWQDGKIQELPTTSGDPDGVVGAINDHGQAVGGSGICSPTIQHMSHALLWEHSNVTDLGNLGGTDTNQALDINKHGQVVGISTLPGNGSFRAFLWQRGAMVDLGAIPGLTFYSQANGINEKGQVTGFSCDVNFDCVAFLWENGVMTDLNTLIPAGSPVVPLTVDINDRGEISGIGELANGEHAVLLVPCDENHPSVVGCDYSMVDVSDVASTTPEASGRVPPAALLNQKNPLLRSFPGLQRHLLKTDQRGQPRPDREEKTGCDVALTPQATPDKGSVPLLDELSLNDELEQQQLKVETVNLSSSAIAPDEGLTWHIGVCSLDNNDRLTGMCISACKSQLDTLYCPKGSPGYPAGFVCGRIKAARRVCYFRAP